MSTPRLPSSSQANSELHVAPSRAFKPGLKSQIDLAEESARLLFAPGDSLNISSGKKFREVRDSLDADVPYTGLHAARGTTPRAVDVPNPDAPDGRWDPYALMPRFAFDAAEDAFPIAPTFDGDLDVNNNGASTSNGADGHYRDGLIGGDQALTGAFTVTKKGDYTVLTYSFYYATNKAGGYHENDYSTAQVYMLPGRDGKLAPTHLMTSWHHGAVLTQWEDLAKDDQGRPIVKVNLGSHALEAVPKGRQPGRDGLQIAGDGSVSVDGRPVDQRLAFEAFQTNVANARHLDPAAPASAPRLEAMRWGEAAMNPFLPELFEQAPPTWRQWLDRGVRAAKSALDTGWDKLKGLFG